MLFSSPTATFYGFSLRFFSVLMSEPIYSIVRSTACNITGMAGAEVDVRTTVRWAAHEGPQGGPRAVFPTADGAADVGGRFVMVMPLLFLHLVPVCGSSRPVPAVHCGTTNRACGKVCKYYM